MSFWKFVFENKFMVIFVYWHVHTQKKISNNC